MYPMGQVIPLHQQTPLSIYGEYFPDFHPSCFQQDLLSNIEDLKIWREALYFWAANSYRAQSIGKLMEYYEQLLGKREPKFAANVTQGRSPNADCDKCGNERRIRGALESWPCDACRPQELMAWGKGRNRR